MRNVEVLNFKNISRFTITIKFIKAVMIITIMLSNNEEKLEVICDRCGYKWLTISKLIWLNCPSCRLKTKRIKEVKPDENSLV